MAKKENKKKTGKDKKDNNDFERGPLGSQGFGGCEKETWYVYWRYR
jgi:hypothetical protein